MEQLIWSLIIIAFIIFTALKNRARNRPDTGKAWITDAEHKARDEHDRLGKYMEDLLGIERTEAEPRIEIEREAHKPFNEVVTTGEKPEAEKKIGQFETPLHRERQKPPLPEKREICHSKFPWGTLSKRDLPNAIILSEIIGPPISKRKSHRLF